MAWVYLFTQRGQKKIFMTFISNNIIIGLIYGDAIGNINSIIYPCFLCIMLVYCDVLCCAVVFCCLVFEKKKSLKQKNKKKQKQKQKHRDFCKLNLTTDGKGDVKHANIVSTLQKLYKHKNKDIFITQLNLGIYQSEFETYYGAPQSVYNVIDFTQTHPYLQNHNNHDNYNYNYNDSDNMFGFSMQLTWINKTKTRMPENLWFIFNSNVMFILLCVFVFFWLWQHNRKKKAKKKKLKICTKV